MYVFNRVGYSAFISYGHFYSSFFKCLNQYLNLTKKYQKRLLLISNIHSFESFQIELFCPTKSRF